MVKTPDNDQSNIETESNNSFVSIKLGFVNCFLVRTDDNYILIDTGFPRKRKDLEKELEKAGCEPGNLDLILLTHGDFDHSGNGAFLREKYGAKLAMHKDDSGMVKRGDMLWGRNLRNIFTRVIMKILFIAFRMGKFVKFEPEIYLEGGEDLSTYGFNAIVLHLPGHSKGSIGFLTDSGELFCGDLFMNSEKSSLIDDKEQLYASIERLKEFEITTIYPGHGEPFSLEDFWKKQ